MRLWGNSRRHCVKARCSLHYHRNSAGSDPHKSVISESFTPVLDPPLEKKKAQPLPSYWLQEGVFI